jgi:hypothetical protein
VQRRPRFSQNRHGTTPAALQRLVMAWLDLFIVTAGIVGLKFAS